MARALAACLPAGQGGDPDVRCPDARSAQDLAPIVRGSYGGPPMIPNPHDALVKVVFGKPEHAQGMLRAVVPAVMAEKLDWSTLTLRPGSFVDLALKEQHTDLLYSATWHDGGEVLV